MKVLQFPVILVQGVQFFRFSTAPSAALKLPALKIQFAKKSPGRVQAGGDPGGIFKGLNQPVR